MYRITDYLSHELNPYFFPVCIKIHNILLSINSRIESVPLFLSFQYNSTVILLDM